MWTERNHRNDFNTFPSTVSSSFSSGLFSGLFLYCFVFLLPPSFCLFTFIFPPLPLKASEQLELRGPQLNMSPGKNSLKLQRRKTKKGFISPSHTPFPSLHHFVCVCEISLQPGCEMASFYIISHS